MKSILDKLESDIERNLTRAAWVKRIALELPNDLPAEPTIANEKETAFFGKPGCWLSFSRRYGQEFKGSDILKSLERAGWKSLPASLAKWDFYRRTVEPGFQEDIPDTKGRYELTECEQLAPVWIIPADHTGGAQAISFYQSPNGLICRVKVPVEHSRVYAQQIRSLGSWRYERGTARVSFPESWHSLNLANGECVATLHSAPAWVDTEQGISGRVYWAMLYEPHQFPLTNAQFLELIEMASAAIAKAKGRSDD